VLDPPVGFPEEDAVGDAVGGSVVNISVGASVDLTKMFAVGDVVGGSVVKVSVGAPVDLTKCYLLEKLLVHQ